MSDVLLHTCCAPCASSAVERLRLMGHGVTLFFSNANIACPSETARRLSSVCRLAEYLSVPLVVDAPDHQEWLQQVTGLEEAPEGGERCRRCFAFSLARTAVRARELGLSLFTSSLTTSPHKQAEAVFEAGRSADSERFLAVDFKQGDGFQRSVALSRCFSLYRQNYCGCEFSQRRAKAEGGAQG